MLNEKGYLILKYIAYGENGICFWSEIALNVVSFSPHPALPRYFFCLKKAKTSRTEETDSNKNETQYGLVSIYFGLNQQIA